MSIPKPELPVAGQMICVECSFCCGNRACVSFSDVRMLGELSATTTSVLPQSEVIHSLNGCEYSKWFSHAEKHRNYCAPSDNPPPERNP